MHNQAETAAALIQRMMLMIQALDMRPQEPAHKLVSQIQT